MSYEINEENLKLKFDKENPLLPNWEVYEQISGLSLDEIPTKGKMGLLISTHFREVKEFLDEDEIKSYKSAIEQISKMTEAEYGKFVVDTLELYKEFFEK
ncbi:hypothetical protein [Lactococcus formosensis]|uniref:hypothetical protein n=1 Tax=Lactococcus formosensis TaxID=1281486 RepID=UPI00254D91CC|nr:hypothetical protein [Lactococcus formosensis]